MNLQYISDSKGKTTGVFIPINEWKKIIRKFRGIDLENVDIPVWHIQEVRKRQKDFQDHPEQAMDFDQAMDALEKQL
ncbi:MAG TPA: hypothetical protein PLE85_11025 [Bacteroidales bacterium]|nr:hypothetical protein [Bacteroidales bacterium]